MSKPRSAAVREYAGRSQLLTRAGGTDKWMGGHLVTLCRVALLGLVLLLVAGAYFPFAWDPPRTVHNDVTRSPDGLRFAEMNNARTPGTPGWLPVVRATGNIQIHLAFTPRSLQQKASIMMLASDSWHTDFAIGQAGSNLSVWLRRGGSDANGDPPFVISSALQPGQSNSVELMLQHDELRIIANGKLRLTERLSAHSTSLWGGGEIALGGEVHGGGPWQGSIHQAEVRTTGYTVDYVRPGALSIPKSYLYLPDHIEPFPPTNSEQWLLAFVDLLSFIPVGFLIVLARRPPVHPMPAALLGAALAVLLAAGKFLFHARHTSVANVGMEALGALLGAWLAWRMVHAGRNTTAVVR
jgi:hypothetical protein